MGGLLGPLLILLVFVLVIFWAGTDKHPERVDTGRHPRRAETLGKQAIKNRSVKRGPLASSPPRALVARGENRKSSNEVRHRRGSFRGNSYVNEFFRFSIDLPSRWTLPNRSTRRAVAKTTAPTLFRDPQMRKAMVESVDSSEDQLSLFMCVSGERSGASIGLKATRLDDVGPDFHVRDVLHYFAGNAAKMFAEKPWVGPIESVELGGVQWWRVRFTVRSGGVTLRNLLIARVERGWLLMVATCDRTVGERATIQVALNSVKCW